MTRKLWLALLLLAPLGLYPFLRGSDAVIEPPPDPEKQAPALNDDQRIALACLSIGSAQGFPASVPWEPMRNVGQSQSEAFDQLAKYKPIEFFQVCMNRYESEIQGYRCTFLKQERVEGKLRPKEKLRVHFREKPFSVHMEWLEGKDLAFRTLYVEGENVMHVRLLASWGLLVPKKLDDPQVLKTSRFPITLFGMHLGMKDTLAHLIKAEAKGTLHLRYHGVERRAELGGRPCYKFVRTPYNPPEGDGVNELTIFIDQATLLQVGSILKDTDGNLIAEYFFRDVELNPTYHENQFTPRSPWL